MLYVLLVYTATCIDSSNDEFLSRSLRGGVLVVGSRVSSAYFASTPRRLGKAVTWGLLLR